MSHLRLPLTGLVATLLASVCLGNVFSDSTWFLPAVFAAVIVVAASEGARRLHVPAPLVLVVGVASLVVFATARYTGDVALLHVLPNSEALHRLQSLAAEGRSDIDRYAAPIFPARGIEMLTVVGVGLVAALVDTFAVGLRRAAIAGLPLLALYTVPATVAPHGVSVPAFVVGAGGYLALLLAESRERVGRWGRSMRYSTSRADWHAPADTSPLAATGRRVGAAVLGIAIVVPVILPGVSAGLLGGSGSGVGGRGASGSKDVSRINPIIDLGKDLNRGDNKTVLRYRGDPAYLRLVALDDFDGRTWKPTPIEPKKRQDVERGIPLPPGLSDPNPKTSSYRFEILNLEEQWLPLPYPASKVTGIGGTWLYDENTRNIYSTDTSTQKRKYNATVYNVDVSADALVSADPARNPQGVTSRDLALVPLPPAVETLARDVTKDAKTNYAKAVALQKWFRDPLQFDYSTRAPGGQTADSIAAFLEKRTGYCVHFASAMALMARYLKIPARVAVGFTPGARDSSGRRVVRLHDAHAWPELYFEGTGWVAFEPTPGTRTGSEPDYTRDGTGAASGPNNPTANPTAGATGGTEATKQRQLNRQDQGGEQRRNPNPAVLTEATTSFPWIPVSLAAIAVVALVGPFLTRTLVRRRRFAHLGSPVAAAAAAWAELQDLLADHGYAWRESETPRRGAERLIRDIRLEGPAEAGLRRIARVVERVRYAPEPGQLEDLRADLKDVSRGLLASTTTWGKVKARVFPRSTNRVFGYVGERIADVLDGIDRGLAAARSRVLPRRAV